MRQSVIALVIGSPIVFSLYIWKARVDRQIGRELAANNPAGLPSPDGLPVWSPSWRAYQALDGGQLPRLVRLSYWLNWAVALVSGATIIAYLYL
jgi:hypothetical protein